NCQTILQYKIGTGTLGDLSISVKGKIMQVAISDSGPLNHGDSFFGDRLSKLVKLHVPSYESIMSLVRNLQPA
uniref:hypothetical protein n=1 Tax=Candidatus Entotheonella palauensis TaxID=93172 RepID=UPI001C4E25B8